MQKCLDNYIGLLISYVLMFVSVIELEICCLFLDADTII